ncbi:TD and POZ domain-containing protein 5 [Caerostris extrusa]|uniref:TD and POZ domain-containing protein 5 n=1 Tax=Caerostris extrusa TaxID=172846 RepID=A0AAV4SZN3_CAEEX|nr:TD and POZ domain-containing protein 5 [Caerostris extrusa]
MNGKDTKWKLRIYPRGCKEENFIALFLCGDEDVECPEDIALNYKLEIVSQNKIVKSGNNIFKKKEIIWGFLEFIKREDVIINRRSEILPQDALTIRCTIRRNDDKDIEAGQFSALTDIKVTRRSFVWEIRDFSNLKTNKQMSVVVRSPSKEASIILKLFLFEVKYLEEVINIHICSSCEAINCLTLTFSLIDVEGNRVECGKTELLSDQLKEGTTFALQTSKLEIMENKNYLRKNCLSLGCEYAFSTGSISEEIESVLNFGADYRKEIIETELKPKALYEHDDLLDDLKSLYRDETLSDMELRTETETFRVHANILSARSEVFKAMFTTEMKETSNRHVYIPDVDNDTLRRMILYLYTDHLEGLEWESASLLYAAADKYAIHSLRKKCSVFLRNAFSFLMLVIS